MVLTVKEEEVSVFTETQGQTKDAIATRTNTTFTITSNLSVVGLTGFNIIQTAYKRCCYRLVRVSNISLSFFIVLKQSVTTQGRS